MRKTKELASLSLAFAMVAGALATPTIAYAEETNNVVADKVEINYENEEVVVKNVTGDAVRYTTKWTAATADKAVWDEAYATSATQAAIAITPSKKEQTIYITDNTNATPYELTIPKQETGLMVGFSGAEETTAKSAVKVAGHWNAFNDEITAYTTNWDYGYLCASVKNGTTPTALAATDVQYLEYKVGTTGKWHDVSNLNVKKYAAKGTTFYFRVKAKATASTTTSAALTNLGFTSKEVKVAYKKQANKPTVKIDGATKKISLSKNQEYRVSTSANAYGDWMKPELEGSKVKVTYLEDLKSASGTAWGYEESKENMNIQVRTAGTDKAIPSKIATVKLNKVDTPATSTSAGISFELVDVSSMDKGIKVTNTATGSAYQVAVVTATTGALDMTSKDIKWKTVKAATATKTASIILKKSDLDGKSNIIFRTATVKDDKSTKTVDEFKVSSKAVDFDFKENLKVQKFAVSGAALATAVTGASVSTSAPANNATEVKVTYTATGSALKVNVTCKAENIATGSDIKVECVKSASDKAAAATSKYITATAPATTGATETVIVFDIKDTAKDEANFYRVTIGDYKMYIKVNFDGQ